MEIAKHSASFHQPYGRAEPDLLIYLTIARIDNYFHLFTCSRI